jgi:hypothetical protein
LKKYYTVYKTTNLINNKIYIGVHSTNNLNDSYLGSGKNFLKALKEYGKENFKKEILFIFDNKKEMLEKEKELVNKEFILNENTYNIILGGGDLTTENLINVYNKNDKTKKCKLITLEEYYNNKDDYIFQLSGGLINVYHKNNLNKLIKIPIEEYYNNKDDYVIYSSDKVVVHDPNNPGNFIQIDKEEYDKGNYKSHAANTVKVIDPNNSHKCISITKEEYDKGNYKSINKDKQTCIEVKTGKVIQVEKTDPRWKTGEIIGNQKGKKWLKKDGKCTLVHSEKINSYINDGWEFGFINNKGKHKND